MAYLQRMPTDTSPRPREERDETDKIDPVVDILNLRAHPLDPFFRPDSVAVVGATDKPGSVGRTLLKNLIANPFGGAVYPVNPKRRHVLGIKTYESISTCPQEVELAIVITPAKTVPGVIRECASAKVKTAIIISAGFREVGPEGAKLEAEVREAAIAGGIRVIGPNCLGVINPISGLNASFANLMPQKGCVAFISQSGAMITSVLDWSVSQRVGFSAVISIGAMMDLDFSSMIDFLGNDPNTKSIVLYMETIGNARRFLAAAREVALQKPIIVIKAGRSEAAAKAAASHTGSLTGSDAVLDAAFQRAGVLRVDSMEDLFEMADVLSKQPLPKGNRLGIVTNAGGPGCLATDALARYGGELAELDKKTIEALNEVLPDAWSHGNPVDILGDATPESYQRSLEIVARDPNCDGLLVILTPQAMTDPTACAEALVKHGALQNKPVLASWMGGPDVRKGIEVLNDAKIPTYQYPDLATRTFNYMHEYQANLRDLYNRVSIDADLAVTESGRRDSAQNLIRKLRKEGRTLMTEAESKELLRAFNLPVTACELAATPDEAATAAEKIGFPVVLKLNSTTITHKMDVGGVKLNLNNADDVRAAFAEMKQSVSQLACPEGFEGATVQPMIKLRGYEVILGSSVDAQLGPVMLFGMGGSLVEVFKDSALGLPPLNANLAKRMLEGTKIYTALKGVRGQKSVDIDELMRIMVRFSIMLVELPEIMECDINPLIVSPDGILCLDSRVLLHGADVEELPQPAIRPYPTQYVTQVCIKGAKGTTTTVRPIMPEDEGMMTAFYARVSKDSFDGPHICATEKKTHGQLMRICFADYERDIVLIAVEEGSPAGVEKVIMGAGRCKMDNIRKDCSFSLQVDNEYRRRGVGSLLMKKLVEAATQEKCSHIRADVRRENERAFSFLRSHGFSIGAEDGEAELVPVALQLNRPTH